MSNFYDLNQIKKEYIQIVFSLQSILQNYNCNYLFYSTFNDSVISQANENIDFTRWIKPRTSLDGYLNSFKREDVRIEYNVDFVKVDGIWDDHPNTLGHQKWFEVISSIIDSKNIL